MTKFQDDGYYQMQTQISGMSSGTNQRVLGNKKERGQQKINFQPQARLESVTNRHYTSHTLASLGKIHKGKNPPQKETEMTSVNKIVPSHGGKGIGKTEKASNKSINASKCHSESDGIFFEDSYEDSYLKLSPDKKSEQDASWNVKLPIRKRKAEADFLWTNLLPIERRRSFPCKSQIEESGHRRFMEGDHLKRCPHSGLQDSGMSIAPYSTTSSSEFTHLQQTLPQVPYRAADDLVFSTILFYKSVMNGLNQKSLNLSKASSSSGNIVSEIIDSNKNLETNTENPEIKEQSPVGQSKNTVELATNIEPSPVEAIEQNSLHKKNGRSAKDCMAEMLGQISPPPEPEMFEGEEGVQKDPMQSETLVCQSRIERTRDISPTAGSSKEIKIIRTKKSGIGKLLEKLKTGLKGILSCFPYNRKKIGKISDWEKA